jgi:hypothetical protein
MSALTLTALAENIYRARDIVARELVGFIPSILSNTDSEQVSTGGTVDSIVTSQPTVNTSVTPSMTIPNGDAQTIAVKQLTLDKTASVRIPMTGENARKLSNIGQYQTAVDQMFAQAIRGIVNSIETNVGLALDLSASRATATAGTTPFASNFNSIADLRKILVDNGTPVDDLSLIVDTSAGTKLRQISGLWQANTAGSDATLRQGTLLDMHGFKIKESAQVASHTKGTGASYLVDLVAGYAVGDTTIHVDTGTGTILAGDVVVFDGDTTQYVVKTGFAGDGDGDIVLQEPGLRAALANNATVTVSATHASNIGLHRQACELAMRPIAEPEGGDAATDRIIIADDMSPLVFTVSMYRGYHAAMMEVAAVYGTKVWKPEFTAKLLG